jgi:hypothetical protein
MFASEERIEYLCFLSSTDKKDSLVSSKVAYLCITSCYRSQGNTLLILKFGLWKFLFVKEVLESCVASTLC